MNILVTGTRETLTMEQMDVVAKVLSEFLFDGPHLLIDGQALGVDSFANLWAKDQGWGTRRFPADWKRFGKQAGPIRNQEMIETMAEEGTPVELVLAFPIPESRGTWDMVERAVFNRIPVRVYAL